MSFVLFIIYLLVAFARPAEHFPELQPWRLTEVVSALALAAAAFSFLTESNPGRFRSVQLSLMLVFVVWGCVTVALSPYRSVALDNLFGFAKSSLTGFLLAIVNVTTTRRLRVVAFLLTFVAAWLAFGAISDYHRRVVDEGQVARSEMAEGPAWYDSAAPAPPAGAGDEWRIKRPGLFGDPNDLALTLVAIVPFTLALRGKSRLLNAILVWVPTAMIMYGVYVTRSRGGVVALAGVLGLLVRHRVGTTLSLVTAGGGLMLLLAAGFVGGRTMSIDASASGRIEMWSTGLQLLKESPVWGGGLGTFTEHTGMAAHSAFVECFADLGLVGYMLWIALIVLTLADLRLVLVSTVDHLSELRVWSRTVAVALVGFLVGGLFLSRAYDIHLFLLIGLGAALAVMARRCGIGHSRGILSWAYMVGAMTMGSILGFWLYMRLLR
jgi:putative inorganic carbon (HCO3(-)) transporter